MTTDLVTVAPDDPVELAANLLDWHRIRHVLVEESDGTLVGLVSYRAVLRLVANGADASALTVADVMKREPVCVPPDMAPLRALELMRQFGIGALPVVSDGQLVGIVTEHDFFNVAGCCCSSSSTRQGGPTAKRRVSSLTGPAGGGFGAEALPEPPVRWSVRLRRSTSSSSSGPAARPAPPSSIGKTLHFR